MSERLLASGRFELLELLGSGGMGLVYEARDRESDTLVAIKTLKAFDPELLFRLKQEFRALADLQHPNLVRLGELYCDAGPDAQWFFTMELVRGRDFFEHVRLPEAAADPAGAPAG